MDKDGIKKGVIRIILAAIMVTLVFAITVPAIDARVKCPNYEMTINSIEISHPEDNKTVKTEKITVSGRTEGYKSNDILTNCYDDEPKIYLNGEYIGKAKLYFAQWKGRFYYANWELENVTLSNGTNTIKARLVQPFKYALPDPIKEYSITVKYGNNWKDEWIGEETEGGNTVTTKEVQDAIYHWLDDILVRGHKMSTTDLQEIIALWQSG